MKKPFFIATLIVLSNYSLFSQSATTSKTYPKIVAYVSFIHPIITFDKNGSNFNFSNSYNVGFPMGINILKNDRIGFSFEVAPFIKSQNDTAKVNFLLFHPGAIFRFKHNFAIIARLAFETNGRFGFTPVFNKVVVKAKNVNYFIAASAPLRMGNSKPVSIGLALQLGITF